MRGGELGDLGGLAPARVVFPEPALGGEVLGPLLIQSERDIVLIDRDRAGPGGVDADADDGGCGKAFDLLRLGEGALHALFQTEKVVAWMLAGEVVVLRVEKDTLLAGGVVDDAGADLRAIGAAHEQRANRVCAVIDTEGVHEFS